MPFGVVSPAPERGPGPGWRFNAPEGRGAPSGAA